MSIIIKSIVNMLSPKSRKQVIEDSRLDYLDAVRTFALLLGVVFHASLSFIPIFIGWAVMDIATSEVVSVFILIAHSFRMALFFLLAGLFSQMKFHQHGAKAFVRSRLVKVAIPFVIGWFLLRPLLVSGWVMGEESMRGEVDILNGLLGGLIHLAELPQGLFLGTHLWFLYYLLLISLSVIGARYLIGLHSPLMTRLTYWFDNVVDWLVYEDLTWLCRSTRVIFLAAVPTAGCLWFMSNWGMDTPDKSLLPNMPVILIYSGFFLFGWLLNHHRQLLAVFCNWSWQKLCICLLSILSVVLLSELEAQLMHQSSLVGNLMKAFFMFSYAVMMWSLVSVSLGCFRRLFTKTNVKVRYLADASYWIYLIHLPLVIWLQIAVAELPIPWLVKLVGISAVTIIISILLYDAFIRSTWIGTLLNGKRKPRCLFIVK